MHRFNFYIFAFLFTIYFTVNAQLDVFRITHQKINTIDGLPNRHINTTFIDAQNRIWFTVDNQLAKYEYGKVKSQSLVSDFSNRGFNSIMQDAAGNLWISESVEWYFPFNTVRTLIYNPTSQKIISSEKYIGKNLKIHSLLVDSQGNVLIGTKDGKVFGFDVQKKQLTLKYNFPQKPIKLLYEGSKGLILCIERNQKDDEKIIHLDNNGRIFKEISLSNSFVRSVIDTETDLLVLFHHDNNRAKIQSLYSSKQIDLRSLKDSYLWNVKYDKTKKLLILNDSNSLIFYNNDLKIINRESFDFQIHDLFIDQANNYFLSTNAGVHILNFSKRKIITYLKNDELDKINENYSCRAILKVSNDEIVLNTNKKRQLINLRNEQIKPLHEFKNIKGDENRFVLSAMKDLNGDFLFGEDGLVRTNLKTLKDEVICNLDTTKIWAIKKYKGGVLLGLEKKGIIYFDEKSKKGIVFKQVSEIFNNSIVYDFYIDSNKIYIAAENGFFQLNDEKYFKKLSFSTNSNNQISCFHVYKDAQRQNTLLIATSSGIWYFDVNTQKLSLFVKDASLLSKKYLSVYRTRNGVWASSEEGIWHFDDDGNLLKIYTEADGLTSNECNRLSHFHDENDRLYFGGINGLNILNPSDFSKNVEPKFSLTLDSVKIYSANKLERTFTNFKNATIRLGRYEENIEFGFLYEDYKYECPKQYYYRTDKSINKAWQLLPDRHLILNNIGHGTSNIEVKVVSCSDFLNAQVIKITIVRKPPIYQEWYFIVLSLAFLGIIIWMVVKFSNYQLKKRNELLQQKVDEQTLSLRESLELKETILSILVHDVRYPVQSFYDITRKLEFLIKKQDTDRLFLLGKETESKSRKVLWLIDELVYWVKSTNKNWQADKEEKMLNQVVLQIFESYQEELKEIELCFEISQETVLARIDTGLMVIVLRNLIFNAIIHSAPQTTIKVNIQQQEKDRFLIEILNEISQETLSSYKGLGIGLSLLQPMIKKSNIIINSHSKDGIYIAGIKF